MADYKQQLAPNARVPKLSVWSNAFWVPYLRKGVIIFMIFSGGVLNYLFVFNILKFEKAGDDHNRMFTLEPKKYNLARVIITTILVSLCILAIIDILQQYHNEQRNLRV
jgi:hypothetical protein